MGTCFSKSKVDAQNEQPQKTNNSSSQPAAQSKPKTDKPNDALKDDGTVPNILQRPYGDILKHYEVQRVLGYGQFGTTRLVKEYSTQKNWAVKTIPKRKLKNKLDQEDVLREVQIMEHLKGYPNIVYLKETFEDKNYVHMIMECCSGGELFDRIVQRGQYTERTAADIISVILGIVQHCHRLGVMHRDLKPENFLLTSKGDDGVLKATDFGLSVFYREGEKLSELVGSPYYVAPEVLKRRYDLKADIWSCGVMLYVLLSGVPPFWGENEQEIFEAIQKSPLDLKSDPWPSISDNAKDCVAKMLTRDVSKRPTIDQVLEHPFIKTGSQAPDKNLNDVITGRLKNFQGQNKLKRQALRLISENLAANQIAGLKEWFKNLDKNGDGQITVQEFQQSLRQKGFENMSDDELKAIVNAADIDKDGNINYNEFIAATLNSRMAITEENVRQVFEKLDKDNSGYLDAEELKEAIRDYQGDFSKDLSDIMKEADKDGDGRIDYQEFLEMMLKQTQSEEFAPAQKNKIRW